ASLTHDRGEHLLAREPWSSQVACDGSADARQRATKRGQLVILRLVANLPPASVVAILLAAARVSPCRLNVAVLEPADPNLRPRRRDRERANAREVAGGAEEPAVCIEVAKAPGRADSAYPRISIRHIAKPGAASAAVACD